MSNTDRNIGNDNDKIIDNDDENGDWRWSGIEERMLILANYPLLIRTVEAM